MVKNQEKIFCGNGKEINFKNGGSVIKLNICLSGLPEKHISEYNGKNYIKLEVNTRRELGEKGQTHYVTVDTWTPFNEKQNIEPGENENSGFPEDRF